MNFTKLSFGLFVVLTCYSCGNKQYDIEAKFNGMWRLDKIEALDTVSGKWMIDSSRIGNNGFIVYDGKGHMGVHMTPKGYKDFDANRNIESLDIKELKEMVSFYKSNFVYFADYKINGQTIIHKKYSATNPKDWNSLVTRNFEFKNDTLILSNRGLRLRWIKL